MNRFRTFLLIALMLLCPLMAQAKPIALIIGGGTGGIRPMEADQVQQLPPAFNWKIVLEQMGWEVRMSFGDPDGNMRPKCAHCYEFTLGKLDQLFNETIRDVKNKNESDRDVLVLMITHGALHSVIDWKTLSQTIKDEQDVISSNDKIPFSHVLEKLEALDEANENGTVFLMNHSCFSGAAILTMEKNESGICSLSISGNHQVGLSGNYFETLGYHLAGSSAKKSSVKFLDINKKDFLGMKSVKEFVSKGMQADEVTQAIFSKGFGLDDLNDESHSVFANKITKYGVSEDKAEAFLELSKQHAVVNDVDEIIYKSFPHNINPKKFELAKKVIIQNETLMKALVRAGFEKYLSMNDRDSKDLIGWKKNRSEEDVKKLFDHFIKDVDVLEYTNDQLADFLSYLSIPADADKDEKMEQFKLLLSSEDLSSLQSIQLREDVTSSQLQPFNREQAAADRQKKIDEEKVQEEKQQILNKFQRMRNALMGEALANSTGKCADFRLVR